MINLIVHGYRLTQHAVRDRKIKARRSPKWPAIEKKVLEEHKGGCIACGSNDNLTVHHIIPFHIAPELELVESNLAVFCMSKDRHCHLLVAHAGDFKGYSASPISDASAIYIMYKTNDEPGVKKLLIMFSAGRKY